MWDRENIHDPMWDRENIHDPNFNFNFKLRMKTTMKIWNKPNT